MGIYLASCSIRYYVCTGNAINGARHMIWACTYSEQPLCIVLDRATAGSNRGPRTTCTCSTCSTAALTAGPGPHQGSDVLPVDTLTVPTPPLSVADHRHLYPSSPDRAQSPYFFIYFGLTPTRTHTLPPRRPQPPPATAPARPLSRPHRRRSCASPARSRPRAPSSGSTATAPRAAASSRPSLARLLSPSAPSLLFPCAILVTARRCRSTGWTRDGIRVAFSSWRSWVRGLMLRYVSCATHLDSWFCLHECLMYCT